MLSLFLNLKNCVKNMIFSSTSSPCVQKNKILMTRLQKQNINCSKGLNWGFWVYGFGGSFLFLDGRIAKLIRFTGGFFSRTVPSGFDS